MNVQFCCNQCDFKTSEASAVKKHRMLVHPQSFKDGQSISFYPQNVKFERIETPTCQKCNAEFQTDEALKQHFTNVHTPCSICPQKGSESFHENHLHTFHLNKVLVCEDCGFKCLTQNDLNLHLEEAHKSILLSCSQCKYKATRAKSLLLHKKIHGQPTPFCDKCSLEFETCDELKVHKEKHRRKEKQNIEEMRKILQLKSNPMKSALTFMQSKSNPMKSSPLSTKPLKTNPQKSPHFNHLMKSPHTTTQKTDILCERCDYKQIFAFIGLLKQVKIARFCHKCIKAKRFKCKSCNFISTELSSIKEHYRVHELPVPVTYFV